MTRTSGRCSLRRLPAVAFYAAAASCAKNGAPPPSPSAKRIEALTTSFASLQAEYFVQAELVPYEEYNRKELPPTWLPKSCISYGAGNDGAYGKPGGTLYSSVRRVTLASLRDAGPTAALTLTMDSEVKDSPADSPGCAGLGDGVDSKWIKTVRINSTALGDFWQRPIMLEACLLLPAGFEEHPEARYPLVVQHGHFSPSMTTSGGGPWRDRAPSCDPDKPVSPSNPATGYECVQEHYGYYLYRNWTDMSAGSKFHGSRVLLITVNHPTPFFDDSYAVDSESTGPYGRAINYELIPEVERRYRGIGEGWARAV